MIRLIIKNLWARRRKNGWLLAELILVSIISWVVLDPVIVVTHDRNIPLGYDAERLCLISLGALQPQAPGYDAEAQDSATLVDNYYNLVRYVKDFDVGESSTPVVGFCYLHTGGIDIKSFRPDTSYRPETYEIQQIMTIYILPNLSGAYPLSWPAYHA